MSDQDWKGWKLVLFMIVIAAFIVVMGLIGQSLKQDRLDNGQGTIPPISFEKEST